MKLKNLTGQKFGRLFVMKRISEIGKKNIHWMCRCDCGVVKSVNGESIKRGLSKSCGCLRKDMGAWNKGKTGMTSHMFRGEGELPASLYSEIKYKANKRGIEFDLTIEELWELYIVQGFKCAISKEYIEFEDRGFMYPNVCSLDRIDSSKGYVRENVQWVDRRVNFMKQSMSQHEFIDMCKAIALNNK